MHEPHSFVFVIHGGDLEAKSALLACSLRQKLHPDHRIVAAVMSPEDSWGAISPVARDLLERLEVTLVPTVNEIDPDYPHGNKIAALASLKGPAVFLDSDMMMMRPFITHHSLLGCDAAVKPADIDTFTRGGGGWSSIYSLFDLPLPPRSLTATSTGERMRPYYNAGFIRVRDGAAFARTWVDTARRIDADPAIRNKRPWLDQIALPVAFARLGWTISEAATLLNFPAHLESIPDPLPYLVHYHLPRVLKENERLRADVKFYCGKFLGLRTVLERNPVWAHFD